MEPVFGSGNTFQYSKQVRERVIKTSCLSFYLVYVVLWEEGYKMIFIEEGLTLTCSYICLKTSVVESSFEHLHEIIRENTSGKYVHRAIYLNCFLALVK